MFVVIGHCQMKKIARRQNEDAQGGEKSKKNGKSNVKPRKTDDPAGMSFTFSSQSLKYACHVPALTVSWPSVDRCSDMLVPNPASRELISFVSYIFSGRVR